MYPIQIPDEINALNKNEILDIANKLNIKSLLKPNLKAINASIIKSSNRYILITGSLYLIGKIRKNYRFGSNQDSSIFFGRLPTFVSTRFPSLKSIRVGIPLTPNF